jgi:SNF2 family DNA or RNA helicase
MSRDRAPFVAQGTWRSKALHVWGWNGESPASAAWMYGGFGRSRWSSSGDGGWHDTPVSYGELQRIQLELGDAGQRGVPAVRLDPFGAAVWLSETPTGSALSPSLAWFASLTQFAVRVVSARRVVPAVLDEGPFTVARWRPVLDDHHAEALRHAAASMPPICRNGSSASTSDIFDSLVDGLARAVLHHAGWRPELGRRRTVEIQAARGVFAALAKHDAVIRSGNDEFEFAVDDLGRTFERHRRRLGGEPVVRGRVRLTLPDDPLDPWLVDLELVDDADPGRWCTVDDVRQDSPRALDLARSPSQLDILRDEASTLVEGVAAAVPELADAGLADGTRVELDLEQADDFLDTAPHELERAGIELIGPEHLVRSKVSVSGVAREAPADDRRGRFGKEALVEWRAVIDDTPISAADLDRAESAGVSLMRAGHRWVRLDPAGLQRARRVLSEQVEQRPRLGALELVQLTAGLHADDAAPLSRDLDGSTAETPDSSWLHELANGLPDDRLEETHEADGFDGELRHYQRRALSWMQFLARVGLGGCLADDMGLGKTATTLAHLLERPGPHLVVCPLSVVHNWESETHRFTPGRSVVVHHGSARQRLASDEAPALFGLADADIVITTYGLLPRDLDALAAIDWTTVVLDEAQMVKNPATKAARAVRRLSAAQKLALTGTPVENRLSELWAILDAVNPGLLGSQKRFREEFATAIERNQSDEAAERLRHLTQPFVLRRTKADRRLLPDLPDKIEQIAYAQLTKEQATLYQGVVDQLLVDAKELDGMQRRGRVLAALTRLKQICNHPAHALKDGSRLEGRSGKLNRFDELVSELLDLDERALVFTQFREMGDLLQTHLQNRFEFDAPFLHGGVARGRRDSMVANFQAGDGPPLLVVSLKAGGTGLNLTAASQVIHYDRWWNPAVEDQATDRAWRMGQRRTVNVHKLVCEGTVEERIGQVIDEKRAIANAVVGSGEAWLSELSTDQLADLVTLEVPR